MKTLTESVIKALERNRVFETHNEDLTNL
jgi:hypothetical protein